MLPLMLAVIDDVDALVRSARTLTAAERPCILAPDATDITVCGRRQADRFRVPFVVHEPGDPRHEGVRAERHRLLAKTDNCQERRAIMVSCGFAGITMTSGGGKTGIDGARKLAP